MDLLGYLRVLRRRWLLIVALGVIGAILGTGSALLNRATSSETARTYYRATNIAVLDSTTTVFQSTFGNLDQVALLATSGTVPEAVATELSLDESGIDLAKRITTTVDQRTNTFSITAVDKDPDAAVLLADTWMDVLAKNLVARDTARYNLQRDQLNQRINTLRGIQDSLIQQGLANPVVKAQYDGSINELTSTYSDLQALTSAGPPQSRFSTLEDANAEPISEGEYTGRLAAGARGENHLNAGSTTPTYATAGGASAVNGPVERGVLGTFLGLLAGVGLALLAERLDRRLRLREDAEQAFGLPVLAEIPQLTASQQKTQEIVTATQPMSRTAEAFRAVRSALLFAYALVNDAAPAAKEGDEPAETKAMVVMVSSPGPGDGKTTITANLAAAFAEGGARVLVVNCDFRRPAIHKLFHVDEEGRRLHETFLPGVQVVANALADPRANPTQVIAAQRSVVEAARSRFDVILLDTAPLLVANDAAELVGPADLVLLAARMERTTTDSARRSVELLNRLDAPLAGIVLVGIDEVPTAYYTYYRDPATAAPNGTSSPPPAATNGSNGNGKGKGATPTTTALFPTDESLGTSS